MTDRRFKELTPENWLEPDPVMRLFVVYSPDEPSRLMTGDDWAHHILAIRLSDVVPEEVRRLFEVARGTLLYGYFFYPLYTLGLQQILRVAENAVTYRCRKQGAPASKKRFMERLEWLRDHGILSTNEHARWEVVRHLRNWGTHSQNQDILLPGMAVGTVQKIANLIHSLFINSLFA